MSEFSRREVEVVAIGQGTGEEAASFMKKWELDLACFGDPDARGYDAFGMLRGSVWSVALRSMLTDPIKSIGLILKADFAGARLAAADVLRLGGVAIIQRGGTLRYMHRAEEPSDIPTNREVLDAIDTV